jgi:hypothetical protein
MLWSTMNEDVEIMVRLSLQEALPHMFVLFGCVTDVDLPAIGPYELSHAPPMVAMVPKMMVGSGRSTVHGAVSVAIVVCDVGRRDLVDRGECVRFLGVGLTIPWLPVGCRATIKHLPRHLVPRQKSVRPQAARATSEAYVL